MCKFIGKSNERILCKLSKSENLRLCSAVHVAMETGKTSNFTCQSKSFISKFLLAKFQLVSCNLSLAIIWQMTYTHKLPKLCSATLSVVQSPSEMAIGATQLCSVTEVASTLLLSCVTKNHIRYDFLAGEKSFRYSVRRHSLTSWVFLFQGKLPNTF